jgi:Zn-finger nucleic acid-binding protein
MSERQGIEIDYCPTCRGVWLDRGELDKIIEKSMAAEKTQQNSRPDSNNKGYKKDYDDNDEYQNRNYPQKRKGGFLGNLFDFD